MAASTKPRPTSELRSRFSAAWALSGGRSSTAMAATARCPSAPQAMACDESPVRASANTARCDVFMAHSCHRSRVQLQVEVKEDPGPRSLFGSIGNNDFMHVLREYPCISELRQEEHVEHEHGQKASTA